VETANKTRSFIRNATLSVIAGNPSADAAHPSGINGIIVTVAIKEKHEPRAPSIPSVRDQSLGFIFKPLLISEERENDHHCCADQVIVKILFESANLH
jgi:hypothetical protein